ncbi:UDP-Glycosyltransferase/glycogen phosphorylase [Meredithblackwellia eburnea MCA 4105]
MKHILAMMIPAHGHTVSYLNLAVQLLNEKKDLLITIVQHNIAIPPMQAELSNCQYDKNRLNIIGVGTPDIPFSPFMIKTAFGELIAGWLEMLPKLNAPDSASWPKPSVIHFDFFAGGPVMIPTRAVVGPDVKFVNWFSSTAGSSISHLLEHDYEQIGNDIFNDEERRHGRDLEQILAAVASAANGTDAQSGMVMKLPGIPDMYDYETQAQATGPPEGLHHLLIGAQKFIKQSASIVITSNEVLEPVASPLSEQKYEKDGVKAFLVGPQINAGCWDPKQKDDITQEKVKSFLDKSLDTYGEKSVLFISFGSLFFPIATPQLVEALVETLLTLEHPYPFIFALGGKLASLPAETIEKVNSSGKGLVCDHWVEQRAILQHDATGFFLTHGGWNSISEGLSQGIPFMVWPANAEQPMNAALLSTGDEPVAFEFFQVRTGTQCGPSLRTFAKITGTVQDATLEFKDIFAKARGAEGKVLTANAEKMSVKLREWRATKGRETIRQLAEFY